MKYTTSLIKNDARNMPHMMITLPKSWALRAVKKSNNALLKLMVFFLLGTGGFFIVKNSPIATSTIMKLVMNVGALLLLTLKSPIKKSQ